VNRVFDAFWRAAAYCVHPRVILWSLLPLVAAGGLVFGLGWFYWEDAVTQVRAALDEWSLIASLLQWLDSIGGGAFRSVIAPLVVVALAVPVIVVATLLLVAWLMTPALVNLVVERRFAGLERRGGAAAWWQGVLWSIGCTLVALLVLCISIPLWFVPPLVLLLPPLVWGWLASRVLAFDALAAHATPGERRLVLHLERWRLLAMGVVCGLLGSAPSMVWALGALALVFAPLIAIVSVWLYTLVFAFASLWFAHFSLARLQSLRAAHAARTPPTPVIESTAPA
jgi:Etoposide-induced protein 2.4 (EI24)